MKALSEALVRQYHERGYCAPVSALSTAEAADLRARLERFEAGAGVLSGTLRHKPHLPMVSSPSAAIHRNSLRTHRP